MSIQPLIRVDSISKNFGGIVALRNVTLDVREGDFLGIIGPNGSGKTTLLNIITGIYKPTSGKVYYMGKDIIGWPPHKICRLGIARTFQIPQPFESMQVVENIKVARLFCGKGAVDEREVLKLVGLEDKAFECAGRLALIEKRLLELARALATSPKVLFLDEVIAGLTESEANVIGDLLTELNKRGITVVWIEHNVKVLMKFVRRVIALHHGEKIAEGSPEEVANNPLVIESYIGRRRV